MGSRVSIDVLGPLRVLDAAGDDVTPTGRLRRRLLALLVLRRGFVVSVDSAADVLWPGALPMDPSAALQNHVLRLRRGLPDGLIEQVGAGYRLDASRIDLDADRVVELLGDAQSSAIPHLRTILGRWSGPAYPELDDVDEGRVEAARLDEYRQRGHEHVAAARLERGDLDGLVTDLTVRAAADPLRERPRELLMTALAATGRTAEALRVFDDFRRALGDELGIDPSPTLAAHHAALLGATRPQGRSARTPLPAPATPLVGRDLLVTELVERVDGVRVLTLVGPGGVGKTRLLIELGHRLRAGRSQRPVVLCPLAQADADSAPDALLAALGIDGRPGTPASDRVVEVLVDDELVLLLDNCEHVLDVTAALVGAIVAGCPNLTIVATSRERLRVAGEHLCRVPPLGTAGEASPAVELFHVRAAAVSAGFEPNAAERALVVDLVGRLDGLPLAIELAAARLHNLELAELTAGMDQRFELLTTGHRDATRHSSLAAAVEWSYDSLDAELARAFVALSIFSSPFTAADAAAVAGLGAARTARVLADLVERSLLQRAPGRRYRMLETLRAFGAERLARSGGDERVHERHAEWMVAWVQDADAALGRPGRPVLDEIDDALQELRVAFGWLMRQERHDEAGRLAVALVNYGFLRLRPDVLAWAQDVLAATATRPVSMTPTLLAAAAYAAWMGGDVRTAATLAGRALEVERSVSGGAVSPRVRVVRGNVDLFEGRLTEAAHWYEQASEAAVGDVVERQFAEATLLLALGYAGDASATGLADRLLAEIGDIETAHAAYVWYCAGEADLAAGLDRAATRLERAIELAQLTNASFVLGIAGASKASIEARSGDPDRAMADYRWLIEHWRRAGMWSTQWTMLRSVAALLERVGRHRDAAVLEGAVRSTRDGHRIFGADAEALDDLSNRLRVALGDEAYVEALAHGSVLDGASAVEHALRSL